ncbi:cysteine synthase [Alteromonas sp. MB-3u-76]|jgi:cysteine synthase A|uniref:PLP-dependent cysteine synthase family protein n=1 Tax=unclassified Alteromonas TaxID=2614992 RepID=UPI000903209E|nr:MULTISPECIES: PLP-dependent cysteine synthase family protein [unclassified Alteromonas]APE05844.1 cysteine synthase [Alteromonas sp. RW2A1]AUC87732.1 cysteine synthase [Alteromonas sp. MB-3u-76]
MSNWVTQAVKKINADYQRSADTHLIKLEALKLDGIDIYLKDESTHPTGSLKHRLARSLFLYALCNGKINQHTTVVEASSGSTAVSEAYFARMIGVPFIAVMPRSTAQKKIALIEQFGGRCHFVDCPTQMHDEAIRVAKLHNGYFMDQFMFAERATDWRGNNNIAESIFHQMQAEPYPVPHSIVMSAGTGGTSATIGRYIRFKGKTSKLIVVDPEYSVFFDSYKQGNGKLTANRGSRIEGIGRPKVEASFQGDVIDDMIQVPDAASVATMHWLNDTLGINAGPSTGTNLWGALKVAQSMLENGEQGSIVTLMCDSGERYLDTYYNGKWIDREIGCTGEYEEILNALEVG